MIVSSSERSFVAQITRLVQEIFRFVEIIQIEFPMLFF